VCSALVNARGMIEWLCIQERWNPEVAIIVGTAACYHRAAVGSSHDDAHPDNLTLHMGALRTHPVFVESLILISSRTGTRTQVSGMLPAFSCISWACAFAGDHWVTCRWFKLRSWLNGLAHLEFYIIAALALNRSAHRRSGRRCKPMKYSEKPSEPEQ